MSKVSDVYQAYLTKIGTLLPSHSRLSNPYKPDENPSILIKQGYGLQLGPGTNTNRNMGCSLSVRREFTVVITRLYLAREDDGAAKAVTEKQLLEDAVLIQLDVERDPTINSTATSSFYISDGGIEYVSNDTDRFLKTEIKFESEYFENL